MQPPDERQIGQRRRGIAHLADVLRSSSADAPRESHKRRLDTRHGGAYTGGRMFTKVLTHFRQQYLGVLALFIVLGGTSYAVATNSIGSAQIKNNSVRSTDVRNGCAAHPGLQGRTAAARATRPPGRPRSERCHRPRRNQLGQARRILDGDGRSPWAAPTEVAADVHQGPWGDRDRQWRRDGPQSLARSVGAHRCPQVRHHDRVLQVRADQRRADSGSAVEL